MSDFLAMFAEVANVIDPQITQINAQSIVFICGPLRHLRIITPASRSGSTSIDL